MRKQCLQEEIHSLISCYVTLATRNFKAKARTSPLPQGKLVDMSHDETKTNGGPIYNKGMYKQVINAGSRL